MEYQSVRSAIESPLKASFDALSPAVPVYFDNTLNTISDAEGEFIHVNLQFGLAPESSLTTQSDYMRRAIVLRP